MILIILTIDFCNYSALQKYRSLHWRMRLSFLKTMGGVSTENVRTNYQHLQKMLLHLCLVNFLILALVGLWLRAYPLFSIGIFTYKNVLHAHSHFAFGGWIMPALFLLILKYFPESSTLSAFRHWKRIVYMTIGSAYGMLFSFPFQGYGLISVFFSTLSIAAGLYAAFIVRKTTRQQVFSTSRSFLRAGFAYFCISAIGPFATGPLIAMGKAGSEIYYNAIYFYLHFQYNGFFTFLVLAVLYKFIERSRPFNNGRSVFVLLNLACVPAYALSVLWTGPSLIVYIIGGLAALLQLPAIILLLRDIKVIRWKQQQTGWLFPLAITAFIVKCVLQVVSAIPAVAQLAFQHRNYIIAYLHLVLIGFISFFIFWLIPKLGGAYQEKKFSYGIRFFAFAFFSTELLLVLQAANLFPWVWGPYYLQLIFSLSIFFPVGLTMICFSRFGKQQSVVTHCVTS